VPISKFIDYDEYIDSSREVEKILGIESWPTVGNMPVIEFTTDKVSITEEFSVIAPKHQWDEYFQGLIENTKITILEEKVENIRIGFNRELVLTDNGSITLKDSDRIFLACGTIGTYQILKESQLLPPNKLQFPLDHPSMYAARITQVINDDFREIFKNVSPEISIKRKYLVSESAELGIFELREKWPPRIGSLAKRAINLISRQIGLKKRFLPDLYLWIQLAQARSLISSATSAQHSKTIEWSVSNEDLKNYQSILKHAGIFLRSLGMYIEEEIECKSISDLISISQEAFHPSGIIELEELSKLQRIGINVLGASVLGNLSWNNPTLPAMALSRCLTLRAVSHSTH
jgi:hypothetical protein